MTDLRPIGPVMLDLIGLTLSPEERELLQSTAVGGVILFSRNFASPSQVADLVTDIRATRHGELLVAVDQEGGRVQRFRAGFTRLPPAARFLERAGGDLAAAQTFAREAGWLMAAEVRAVDVDFSFAPVLDVDCGISTVIGDRAFSSDADQVACLAGAFATGMREAGMAAVGKHFPGHGCVAADSHLALPVDGRAFESLWDQDLAPYRALVAEGLEGIMPAHVVYSCLDEKPAGFSRFWLREVLRERLGFQGAVFSDDLSMEGAAAAGGYVERVHAALDAGCDMVLVCNRPDAARQVAEALADCCSADSARRLAILRGKGCVEGATLRAGERWHKAAALLEGLVAENEQ